MSHYVIELIIWSLVAYFIGCLIGWLLRNMFGTEESVPMREPEPEPVAVREPEPVKLRVPDPAPVAEPEPVVPVPMPAARMERPRGIDAARGGKPDDLQQISGIGPKNEKILHTLGFFHFDQIAAWGRGEVAWVDDHLKFNGRIGREKWVEQATLLAAGELEEFRRLYGTGGLKNTSGQTQSGERTRRS
jgi:predicted flap endonuclease-1-like 5' DNA nuclease